MDFPVHLHPDQGIVELSVTIPEPSRVAYRLEVREDPRCVQLFPLCHDEILQLIGGYASYSADSWSSRDVLSFPIVPDRPYRWCRTGDNISVNRRISAGFRGATICPIVRGSSRRVHIYVSGLRQTVISTTVFLSLLYCLVCLWLSVIYLSEDGNMKDYHYDSYYQERLHGGLI